MVLIVVEISKEQFDFLSCSSFSHLENGVIFEDGSNNVMAFKKIDFENDNSISYWEVIEKK